MTSKIGTASEKRAIKELVPKKISGDLSGRSVENLKKRLKEIEKQPIFQSYQDLKNTAPHLKDQISTGQRVVGTLIVALLIIAIACNFLSPYFKNPQAFLTLFQNINYVHLSIGIGVPIVLMTGVGLVIYRTSAKREELLGEHHLNIVTKNGVTTIMRDDEEIPENATVISTDRGECHAPKRGSFDRENELETVLIKCAAWKKGATRDYYVDMSTVDESGKALMYQVKPCYNHYMVSFIVSLVATPFQMVGSIVYHLLRAVVIPFYILVQWLREKVTGVQLFEERPFEFKDIFLECGKSLWWVVEDIFYGLAFMAVYVASFWDPARRVQLATIQRDWNHGITFEEGFWLAPGLFNCCQGAPQGFWKFEDGGRPDSRGNGVLMDACQQPTGYVIFNEAKEVVTAYRMEAALKPSKDEQSFQVIFRKDLESAIEGIEEELFELDEEYSQIKKELANRGRY